MFTGTPPTIVLPPVGYWVDGMEDTLPEGEDAEPRAQPGTPRQATRRHNIDTDDTAKYYRRFFLGKVIETLSYIPKDLFVPRQHQEKAISLSAVVENSVLLS